MSIPVEVFIGMYIYLLRNECYSYYWAARKQTHIRIIAFHVSKVRCPKDLAQLLHRLSHNNGIYIFALFWTLNYFPLDKVNEDQTSLDVLVIDICEIDVGMYDFADYASSV